MIDIILDIQSSYLHLDYNKKQKLEPGIYRILVEYTNEKKRYLESENIIIIRLKE